MTRRCCCSELLEHASAQTGALQRTAPHYVTSLRGSHGYDVLDLAMYVTLATHFTRYHTLSA